MSSCLVIYEEGLPNIWGNVQIFSHMRRPLVIYNFATAPFWVSLYMRKFDFLFYQCTFFVHILGLSQVLCFFSQGCGGTLAGTIPSSGTLQWSINAANLMHVAVIFSDWTVSIPLQIFPMCAFKQTIFNCCNSNRI